MAKCRQIFSLVNYNDSTYSLDSINNSLSKTFFDLCCNRSSYLSPRLEYWWDRYLFVVISTMTYAKADREWTVYCNSELKK